MALTGHVVKRKNQMGFLEDDLDEGLRILRAEEKARTPETTCIDCGQPTTPGKGSARCPGCWEDRCGQVETNPECCVCGDADKYCIRCNGGRP